MSNGDIVRVWKGEDVPEGAQRIINHIDLWNHNVEFIEQEENWSCPAVFVEFSPIEWNEIVNFFNSIPKNKKIVLLLAKKVKSISVILFLFSLNKENCFSGISFFSSFNGDSTNRRKK